MMNSLLFDIERAVRKLQAAIRADDPKALKSAANALRRLSSEVEERVQRPVTLCELDQEYVFAEPVDDQGAAIALRTILAGLYYGLVIEKFRLWLKSHDTTGQSVEEVREHFRRANGGRAVTLYAAKKLLAEARR
ncbi:MAG: hypothetical protein ABSG86_29465 [Thermoguttaceae bacterium]|jgi:hypothetical protein